MIGIDTAIRGWRSPCIGGSFWKASSVLATFRRSRPQGHAAIGSGCLFASASAGREVFGKWRRSERIRRKAAGQVKYTWPLLLLLGFLLLGLGSYLDSWA